jgi:serine phosphatase RsbU (regulator of sigma subunit)
MASVEIRCPDSPVRSYALREGETIIGRRSDCDLVLIGQTISRRHARIVSEAGKHYIEDLGSVHGTTVNGDRIEKQTVIGDGDRIAVANTILLFDAGAAASQAPEPTILNALDGHASLDAHGAADPSEKLRALLDFTGSLGTTLDLEQLFPKILESAFRIFPSASRGSIWLVDPSDGELVPRAAHDRDGSSCATPPISTTICERVVQRGEAVLSSDVQADQRFEESRSILVQNIRSVLCAPLWATSGDVVGMIQLDSGSIAETFTAEDLDILVNLANLAGQVVAHAQLHAARLEYEGQKRDLTLARDVQGQFLPKSPPDIDGWQIADFYRPATSVGGDYFDYIDLHDGRVAVVLGDVAGKGVAAALLMARLCSDVRSALFYSTDLVEAMEATNRRVYDNAIFGRFVTLVLCVIEPTTGEISVVNAGQSPPLHGTADGRVESVGDAVAGPPLGVLDDTRYKELHFQLAPGESLLLYTDGVNEAMSPDGEMLGEAVTQEVLIQQSRAPDIIDALMAKVQGHAAGAAANDDVCTIAISRNPAD